MGGDTLTDRKDWKTINFGKNYGMSTRELTAIMSGHRVVKSMDTYTYMKEYHNMVVKSLEEDLKRAKEGREKDRTIIGLQKNNLVELREQVEALTETIEAYREVVKDLVEDQ